jgi:broad specificity phosphatase PhoE
VVETGTGRGELMPSGGESFADAQARVVPFLRKLPKFMKETMEKL